jgi:hypothetical protein
MNETEINEMETEVGRPKPDFELKWAKAALVEQRAMEKTLQSAWRMWKYVRNDQRMAEVKQNLDQARSCIKYLEDLSRELDNPRPS